MWNSSLEGRTLNEIRAALARDLDARGLLADLESLYVPWWGWPGKGDEPFPAQDTRWVACHPVRGDNEGDYLHIAVVGQAGEVPTYRMILGAKTFAGNARAYEIAQACAAWFESWEPIAFGDEDPEALRAAHHVALGLRPDDEIVDLRARNMLVRPRGPQ